MITVKKYSIQEDDTLQSIAALQIGDHTKWLDLVGLNKLRAPYISQDLTDQFGPILGTLSLQQRLGQGDTSIIHWDATVSTNSVFLLAPGNILVFVTYNTSGNKTYDAALIQDVVQTVAPGTAHIQLQVKLISISNYKSITHSMILSKLVGVQQDHTVGEVFQVYASPLQMVTAVAQIGDVISIPVLTRNQNVNLVAISIADLVDALGVDIALDAQGHKFIGGSGDTATLAGLENVKQAIRLRVLTLPGELALHPEYGCMLQFYIGTNQDATWPNVVKALIHDCLVQDPRIHDVVNMVYRQVGDAGYVDVEVQVTISGQLVSNTIPLAQGQ